MSGRRRSKVSQKIYRDRTRQKNHENAAIAEYVAKYYPWVIEAYKNQKEKPVVQNETPVVTLESILEEFTSDEFIPLQTAAIDNKWDEWLKTNEQVVPNENNKDTFN